MNPGRTWHDFHKIKTGTAEGSFTRSLEAVIKTAEEKDLAPQLVEDEDKDEEGERMRQREGGEDSHEEKINSSDTFQGTRVRHCRKPRAFLFMIMTAQKVYQTPALTFRCGCEKLAAQLKHCRQQQHAQAWLRGGKNTTDGCQLIMFPAHGLRAGVGYNTCGTAASQLQTSNSKAGTQSWRKNWKLMH